MEFGGPENQKKKVERQWREFIECREILPSFPPDGHPLGVPQNSLLPFIATLPSMFVFSDLAISILKWIEGAKLVPLRAVCKRWREVISLVPAFWKIEEHEKGVDVEQIGRFFPRTTSCKWSPVNFAFPSNLRHLEQLTLTGPTVMQKPLPYADLSTLRLVLSGDTRFNCRLLSTQTNLTKLTIRAHSFVNPKSLFKLPKLQHLELASLFASIVDDAPLPQLQTTLRTIEMPLAELIGLDVDVPQLDSFIDWPSGTKVLTTLPLALLGKLRRLDFTCHSSSSLLLSSTSTLTNLTHLAVSCGSADPVRNAFWLTLTRLQVLKLDVALNLPPTDCNVPFPYLRLLKLRSADSLQLFRNCLSSLESLELSLASDLSLSFLPLSIKNLTALDVHGNFDLSLPRLFNSILRYSKLVHLNLTTRGAHLSPDFLLQLTSLHDLRTLSVDAFVNPVQLAEMAKLKFPYLRLTALHIPKRESALPDILLRERLAFSPVLSSSLIIGEGIEIFFCFLVGGRTVVARPAHCSPSATISSVQSVTLGPPSGLATTTSITAIRGS